MGWDAITALSGVAGAVGVMISIGFLVFEVRHNTRAIEGATVQDLMSLEKDTFTLLADNAEIYVRGSADFEELEPAERFRFERIVGAQMSLSYSAYAQHRRGLIPSETWTAYFNAATRYLRQPGFRACWHGIRLGYPESFRAVMKKAEARALSGELDMRDVTG